MAENLRITALGRDNEQRNEVHLRFFDEVNTALGTSVGILPKANEDAVGVAVLGAETVLAIADGHWGRDASELAVTRAVELLDLDAPPSKDSETRAHLFALFEQINTALFETAMSAPGAPASETTLIVCHIKQTTSGKYLYWSSFGDSYLFMLRNGVLRQLNTLNAYWLGYLSKLSENSTTKSILMRFLSDEARYVGVASGLETGIEQLKIGDMLFLCTDGLIGSDVQPDPSVLEAVQRLLNLELPLQEKVDKLINSALARGEEDNISCVLAQIS